MRAPRFSGCGSGHRLRYGHGALSSWLVKGESVLGDRTQTAGSTGYNRRPFGRLRGDPDILGRK
ncbi:hypothetical protein Srubr_47340 [Streptomyces rubradiris]|uniref:Uncharacterized protein n=1 Tax=Streptomyces rubradiris TaxID=285531 RepID=A0ABQ3RGA2_STRRR|nr:hypothetical protein GCM10018792_54470 [Streptomyces rubradiris]GHI54888.1 hypothetical protein Srubr_47340 [Streptomyces rubradiris]